MPLFKADSYIEYAKLYVPATLLSEYKSTDIWKNFGYICSITEGSGKCSKPTILYSNGKIVFNCETEGAECVATISDSDIKIHYGNEIPLTATYTVSVYATATGYENSEVATATICWIDADPRTEGIENGIAQVRANAVLIQSHDGTINIAGVADGTDIGAAADDDIVEHHILHHTSIDGVEQGMLEPGEGLEIAVEVA